MTRSLLFLALSAATAAHAQSVPFQNPSFESPVLADGAFQQGGTDWSFLGADAGTFNPSAASYAGGAPDGDNVAFIADGGILQVLPVNLAVNQTYRLRFAVGNRADNPVGANVPLTVSVYGTNVRSSGTMPAGTPVAFQATVFAPAAGTFRYEEFAFTTNAGTPGIGLPLVVALEGTAFPAQFNVDDFSLTAGQPIQQAVPVNGPGALWILGGLALAAGLLALRRNA